MLVLLVAALAAAAELEVDPTGASRALSDSAEYRCAAADGSELRALSAEWGAPPTLRGPVARAEPPDACAPLQPAPAGALLVAQRGACPFADKAEHAAAAGAAALVLAVGNERLVLGGAAPGAAVAPALAVTTADAERLLLSGASLLECWREGGARGEPVTRAAFAAATAGVVARLQSLVTPAEAPAAAAAPRAVWVASFPNSGCTWTRRLLEARTGLATEAVYAAEGAPTGLGTFLDERVAEAGLSPPVDGGPRFIKSHSASYGSDADAVLLVVRHPFDVLVSNWRYLAKWDRVQEDDAGLFVAFAERQAATLARWHCAVSRRSLLPRVVVRFGDLLQEDLGGIERAVELAGWAGDSSLWASAPPRPRYAPPEPVHLGWWPSMAAVERVAAALESALECSGEPVGDLYSGFFRR